MGDVRYVAMTDAAGRRETGTLVGLHARRGSRFTTLKGVCAYPLAVAIIGVVAVVASGEVKIAGDLDGGKCRSAVAAAVGFWSVVHSPLADSRNAEHAGIRKTLQPPLAPDAHNPQLLGLS